jgi:hypothetical protein
MATKLHKPVFRESTAFVRERGLRPLIVGFLPGNVIAIRPKGMRTTELLPMSVAWQYAVTLRVRNERLEKAAARKAKRRGAQS